MTSRRDPMHDKKHKPGGLYSKAFRHYQSGWHSDGFARQSAASPTSALIKVQDDADRRLIDDHLRRKLGGAA